MNLKQFRRMKSFAMRMVPVAIGGGRWQKELRGHVREILYRLNNRCFSCHWDHIEGWDHKTDLPDDDGTCGFACRDGRAYLCDFMSEYCFDNGLEWAKEDRRGNVELVESKMGTALSCCIRAACDTAVSPSMGVLGFTAGDLRKMYPKGVPDWVTGGKKHRWTAVPIKGVVPGVGFVPGKPKVNGTFASMPDEAGVWL